MQAMCRWNAQMELPQLKAHHWRKTSQWLGLNRRHAELIVNDTAVAAAFKECAHESMHCSRPAFCMRELHVC